MSHLDLSSLRAQFPALQQKDEKGRPYVFFDGPGGTQVPRAVIDAIAHYYTHANSNSHGNFLYSARTDATVMAAREAVADFLNAPSPQEVVFGPSMTNLTFNLSRAIGAQLGSGDEIVVTRLDHDANVSPWLALQEQGVVIKYADFDVEDCTLDLAHFKSLLSDKTKLVAIGYASNAVGTINPVKEVGALAHEVGARVWIDAVHYAPHGPINVQDIDCDFLVCSVYKFFGPHIAVAWGRYDLLDALPAYKVRPAGDDPPDKFETGTGNFEGMAGTTAAINYLAQLGDHFGAAFEAQWIEAGFTGRRLALKKAMTAIANYERTLLERLVEGLMAVSGVRIYGITDKVQFYQRTPTIAFTKDGVETETIAKVLGENNIFVWDGHYYALEVVKRLGLYDRGGMVRVGIAHYNTAAEVDRLLAVLRDL
jgi:cysteine desulfurase family protein (TIGR01976 family)